STLRFNITANPKNGTLTGTGATRTYTPKANFAGKDSFMFTSSIRCLASPPAKVNILVKPMTITMALAHIGNKSISVNNTLTFNAANTAYDNIAEARFSLIGAPAGA